MVRPSSPSVFAQLPSLLSPDTRVAALRTLKNELIGHDEKKEVWVRSGVLQPLAAVMTSREEPDSRTNKRTEGKSEQEEARLQAIIVVGSLAQGQYAHNPELAVKPILSHFILLYTAEREGYMPLN